MKKAKNPLLKLASWIGWSPHLDDENDARPLWFTATSVGPPTGGDVSNIPQSARIADALHFETEHNYTETQMAELKSMISKGDSIELRCHLKTSHSALGQPQEFQNYCGEYCVIIFSVDTYHRLRAEVRFDDNVAWVEFTRGLFTTRLNRPSELQHRDIRFWQLLAFVSPELRQSVATDLRRALEEFLHIELELTLSAIGAYSAVIPNSIQDRDKILRALFAKNSLFTKKQIGILFPYDTRGKGNAKDLEPARHETVQSLIEEAQVTPVFKAGFSTLQITQQLIPTVCNRPKPQERYLDVRDEIRGLGIDVPDEPVLGLDP